MTEASFQAQAALQDTIREAGTLSDAASTALQNAMSATVKEWVQSHPFVFWLVAHPVVAIALFFALTLLLLGLFQALGSLVKDLWLVILKSPVKIISSIFSFSSQPPRGISGFALKKNAGSGVESMSLESQERLANILNRLEVLRQEQNQLLQEAAAILGTTLKV